MSRLPIPSTALRALLVLTAGAAVAAGGFLLFGGDAGDEARASDAPASSGNAAAIADGAHPVAGHFHPDGTNLEDCDDQACYEQAFGNISYYEGPKPALALFDEKIAEGGAIESGCHRIAHTIGSAALARYHGNVARAFAEGSASCWSGYYHGILERAFTGVGSSEDLGRVARGLCDDPQVREVTWLAYQCVHGIGHGLMIHTGYNLPFSLDICEKLATDWDRTSCKGGVFMENLSSSYGVESQWLKDDDPVYPCDAVEENDKLYCYLMVTSRILRVEDYDWKKTAEICRAVEPNWVATCFQSYGRDASGTTRQDPEKIAELCDYAEAYEGDCISAAAKDMTANYASGKQAAVLCQQTRTDLRGGCFYAVGSILGTFSGSKEEHRAACEAITKRYAGQCRRAADAYVTQ